MECLLEQEVDTVFGYPGGTILNLYDELYHYQDKIHHVLTAHEQGAAHAADGYARSTGKVGVCFATSGPGATNLTTGIATAYMDSSPVVFITCNVSEGLLGKDSFQEVDITGIAMPITKATYLVRDPQTIPDVMRQAFAVAATGRPGPVLIDFLKNSSTLDVDNMKWNMEDTNLKMTRPAFGGHLMATIICPRFRPCMATVRPGVMKKNVFDQAKADACEIVKPSFQLSESDLNTEVVEVVKAAKKLVDLIGADYIVSVGRGISKDVEGGIKLAEELADVLGGVVGGSRATIDSGWLSADHQVGQTGKTVHPKVYIALGISGAIQHKAGMQDSECIIAVNKNDTAPIFEIADYGICGDLFKVTPMLIEAIKAAKAAK